MIAEQNRMEAEHASELGVNPVIGQSPKAAMAEQNDHVDRERDAEAKIRKLASG